MNNTVSRNNVEGRPFQILSLCETLTRIFDVYTNTFFACLKVSITCLLPLQILLHVFGWQSYVEKITADPINPFNINWILILFVTILTFIPSLLASGALIMVVTSFYLGEDPEFGQCLKKSWERLSTMLGALVMLLGILVPGATVMCVGIYYFFSVRVGFGPILIYFGGCVYLIFFSLKLSLWRASVMIENCTAYESMRRSWSLTSQNLCYIFCTMGCVSIALVIFLIIVASILPMVIVQIVNTILMPCISEITLTVIYFNLRVKRENLNAELLRRYATTNSDHPVSAMDGDDYTEVQMKENSLASDADENNIV